MDDEELADVRSAAATEGEQHNSAFCAPLPAGGSTPGADGDVCGRVTAELEWCRWAWSGQPPTTLEVPVHLLWIE